MERPTYPRKAPFVLSLALGFAFCMTLVDIPWSWYKTGHFASISDIAVRFLLYGCGGMISGFWVWKWHEPTASAVVADSLGVTTADRSEQQNDSA
jgi:hypothetical protein